MARIDDVGHIVLGCGVVCRGCGCVVYTSGDYLEKHLTGCSQLQEENRKRLSGDPR